MCVYIATKKCLEIRTKKKENDAKYKRKKKNKQVKIVWQMRKLGFEKKEKKIDSVVLSVFYIHIYYICYVSMYTMNRINDTYMII